MSQALTVIQGSKLPCVFFETGSAATRTTSMLPSRHLTERRESVNATNGIAPNILRTTRDPFRVSSRTTISGRVTRGMQSLKLILIALCCLVFLEAITGVAAASNETCSLLRPVPLYTPFPPLVASTPHATVVGSHLVSSHLANSIYASASIAMAYLYQKIKEASCGPDGTRLEFMATLGCHPVLEVDDQEINLRGIPTLSGHRVTVEMDFRQHISFMRVNATDMTDVIMRGTRLPTQPPYDNRQFFVVRVENVFTRAIATQVFHHHYSQGSTVFNWPWVVSDGPILAPRGRELHTNDMFVLGRLFHGLAVAGANGELYRLAG